MTEHFSNLLKLAEAINDNELIIDRVKDIKKLFSVDLEDLLEKKLEYQEKSELESPKEEIEVEKNFFN